MCVHVGVGRARAQSPQNCLCLRICRFTTFLRETLQMRKLRPREV
jgi:hypothetical protein